MKLTDKRFWKFEAMMLLCGFLLQCQVVIVLICNDAELESCSGLILILLLPLLCLYFSISGIPAWLLYKGNSWLKLRIFISIFCPAADRSTINILIRLESCHSKYATGKTYLRMRANTLQTTNL